MPPPPAAITSEPRSTSAEIAAASRKCCGLGDEHHPAVAASRILDHRPASRDAVERSLRLREERSDRLGWFGESGIVVIDLDVSHDRGRTRDVIAADLLDGQAQHAAQKTLSHRPERGQRLGRDGVGRAVLDAEVAHLRAVAVHDDEAPPVDDHPPQRLGHGDGAPILLIEGAGLILASQRVASDGDNCERSVAQSSVPIGAANLILVSCRCSRWTGSGSSTQYVCTPAGARHRCHGMLGHDPSGPRRTGREARSDR